MTEFRHNKRYDILTPDGYKPFSGVRRTRKAEIKNITLSNGINIKASLDHRFIIDSIEILAKDLKKGQYIYPGTYIEETSKAKGDFILYDPTDVGEKHVFIADGIISHNCDTDFLASGDTVFEPDDLIYYEETYQKEPLERRGVDGNLWIWESPDYSKSYLVVADVARGDSADYSAFHVIDVETCIQVAEYKGKLSPKEFGNVLVGVASEYNDALLIVENANIGWATIEQVMEREYRNLYYSPRNHTDTVESYMNKYERDQLVPGFTMSMRTRPLVIAKMMEYVREKETVIQSKRLLAEMRVFVWKNGKPQAQINYNDDLLMAYATGLYVRDTALRLRQQGMDLARAQMSSFTNLNSKNNAVITTVAKPRDNPYIMETAQGTQDISWLLK